MSAILAPLPAREGGVIRARLARSISLELQASHHIVPVYLNKSINRLRRNRFKFNNSLRHITLLIVKNGLQWLTTVATTVARSDVFIILQEIQRTWSYLEPLFLGSEEVKKELPEDAKRFDIIDTDVKGLLKSVSSCSIELSARETS